MKILAAFIVSTIIFWGCGHQEKSLKVAASPVPHAELLNLIKSDLKEKGIHLKIIEIDDYNLPNRLLAERQVDANFFQHRPFLEEQEKEFGYKLTAYACVHIEPLGIYSKKIKSLADLPMGAVVAIPSDPTNEARSLELLSSQGLITLKKDKNSLSTCLDILENPKKIRFHEVDAALTPRILPDVDLAVIPGNFALQAHLLPSQDALVLESGENSPYANLLVIREGEGDREDLRLLKEALTSEKIRTYLIENYRGALLPALCL